MRMIKSDISFSVAPNHLPSSQVFHLFWQVVVFMQDTFKETHARVCQYVKLDLTHGLACLVLSD